MTNFSNMASDINQSFQDVPLNNNNNINNILSPIDEINSNLRPFSNFLRVAHINAVSVPRYRDEILRIGQNTELDILGLSETNIKKITATDRFKFRGYKLFHIDRDWGECGGVGILIKNEYASSAKKINVNYVQRMPKHLFIEIVINKIKILVGVLYKSPSVRYGVFSDIFEVLAYLTTKYDHCIFLTDYNINQLNVSSPAYKFFQNNIIKPLSLTQLVTSPTRITKETVSLIDLILVNSPTSVKFVGTTDISFSDHSLVYCSYYLKKIKFKPQLIRRRDMRNFAHDNFIRDMANADWGTVEGLNENNIENAALKLENTFSNILDSNAPMREIKVTKPICASWMTEDIIFYMDLRDKYKFKWNEIKKHNFLNQLPDSALDIFYYTKFKEIKNKVNHLIRKAKFNDFNSKINNKLSDSKKFHFNLKDLNVVNSKKQSEVKCHLDPNKLNESFAKNNNARISDSHIAKTIRKINRNSSRVKFQFKDVSINEVIDTVKSLKSNACGIDEISAFFIKLSINSTARIFSEIVNASLKSGYFPSRWKKARIKPIPKINEPISATDFRPISLLIAFSKIIEKIAAKQMKDYLIKNNFLNKFQSAYKAKHSTTTALVEITDHIFKALDNSEITILVLLDYSKAFDCANHKLILAKLKSMGFNNTSLHWINSYLSNRSQQVVTEKGVSNWIELQNGVPQGSILGPLLFTILVSDIASEVKHCKFHLYADDTQIFISGKVQDIELLISRVNSDLQKISEFSSSNCLKLNEGKSVFIILGSPSNITKINEMVLPDICINNKSIKRESVVKNLGVLFDENMSWESEINKLIKNGYFKLRQAYRFKNFLSKESKKLLVQSYILSNFNYSGIIIQNNCIRFILNLRKFDHL